MDKKEFTVSAIPIVPLRGLVVFPGMVLHFDVSRKKSIAAVRAAMNLTQEVFLVSQKDPVVEEPTYKELCKMGVVAKVRQIIAVPETNNLRVIVEGVSRASLVKGYDDLSFMYGDVVKTPERGYAKKNEEYAAALVRKTRDLFDEYAGYTPKMSSDVLLRVINDETPGAIADYIASVIVISYVEKQKILELLHPLKRLEKLCEVLSSEINVLRLESKIAQKVEQAVDENQREFYLREQIRALSEELDGEETVDEIDAYREKIAAIEHMEDSSRERLQKECDRLRKMGASSGAEATVIRNYLDTVLSLPWDTVTKDKLDLKKARKVLDRDHYGLDSVKERIIELLAVRKLSPDINGQIICLAGPPGVGKTSIAKSLAEAMGRKYARVSLGGVRDESEIRGHRKTYIGSMPGRVIHAMRDSGSRNPLVLFDEIDKMSSDMRGDPAAAMLEVLDAEQNKAFVDHYIEIPFDLSEVLFITTANDKSKIPAPLLDRMEVIDLYSYTSEEKFNIAKKHLIPKAIGKHGLSKNQLKVQDAAIREIISAYTREAGVRQLERKVNDICRKVALGVVTDETYSVKVTPGNLKDFLGAPKFKEKTSLKNEVGVTNGLAWTSVGGEMLKVEAAVMSGKGDIQLTGSLGDVMKESARAAVSYVRSNADRYKVDADFYKKKDIHIHVPEGAVPKDGPSAGVTIATSLLSALTGNPVAGTVAMTGEISLTGRVMPIGGLREKTMAAYNAGIKTVIIPKDNVADLDEVDKVVKNHMDFVPVSTLNEVFENAIISGNCEVCSREV